VLSNSHSSLCLLGCPVVLPASSEAAQGGFVFFLCSLTPTFTYGPCFYERTVDLPGTASVQRHPPVTLVTRIVSFLTFYLCFMLSRLRDPTRSRFSFLLGWGFISSDCLMSLCADRPCFVHVSSIVTAVSCSFTQFSVHRPLCTS